MATATEWGQLQELKRDGQYVAYWAAGFHRTHKAKPLDFENNPCLQRLYFDRAPFIVVMKSTQGGVSEWEICYILAWAIAGLSIFFVMPTYQLAGQFVHDRFDATVDNTPAYKSYSKANIFARAPEGVTLKHFGLGGVAFVGSNSRAGFTSYAADIAVEDEVDECDPTNLKMVPERLGFSDYRWRVRVGNPTVKGYGIALAYEESDQKHWHIRCPACRRWIAPDFFKHVVKEEGPGVFRVLDKEWERGSPRDARLICECGRPLDRKRDGQWIAARPASPISGYHMSRLVAGQVTIAEMLDRLEDGTKSEESLVRFYNGDLGLPYVGHGAKIDEDMLDACLGDYGMAGPSGWAGQPGIRVAGVDVGSVFNIIIGRVTPQGLIQIIHIGEVGKTGTMQDAYEVLRTLREWRVVVGVIDAQPEKRISRMIASRHRGMFACFYDEGKRDHVVGKTISVDRTAALDQAKDTVMNQFIVLPRSARSIKGFYEQMCASTRIFDSKARAGKGAWRWVEAGPDHYHHAMAYLLIARNLVVQVTKHNRVRTGAPGVQEG